MHFSNLVNKKFKEFVIDPNISVEIVQYRPISIFINGEVVRPGRYLMGGKEIKNFNVDESENNKDILSSRLDTMNALISESEISEELPIPSQTITAPTLFDAIQLAEGITYEGFINTCISKMNKILSTYWTERDFSLPYKTKYEMLIMASIIEKETSKSSEKPLVASVFVNRLNKNMRLQADPTVIYGMKNFQGNITKKDLNAKNEYNTYKINGLPKTPICSPSESSIKAASKPSISKYLYFVSNNKGEHIFSETYDEHLKAVNKYQK